MIKDLEDLGIDISVGAHGCAPWYSVRSGMVCPVRLNTNEIISPKISSFLIHRELTSVCNQWDSPITPHRYYFYKSVKSVLLRSHALRE